MKKDDEFIDYESRKYLVINFYWILFKIICVVLFLAWISAGPDETFNSFVLYTLGGIGITFLVCGYKW